MAKKKTVPAMYPKPDPIRLSKPLKFVSVDKKTRNVELECSDADDAALLRATHASALRRHDLRERLNGCLASCQILIIPHFGDRPPYITVAKWKSLEQRLRLLRSLPENAPAEAHSALEAVQTIFQILDKLVNADHVTAEIERAICLAIDLGQLLQRSQTQIDHGEAVDVGRRNVRARSEANSAKSRKSQDQSALAETEFNRLMAKETQPRMMTATLENMARRKDHNGKPIYGSLPTLKRYAKTWKSITPSD